MSEGTEPAAAPSEEPVTPRELRMSLAGLMMALMLAGLDQNIVGTALPRIVGDLGGMTHLSWVVTAFMLTMTSSTLVYGKLSDMYGRKPLFFIAIGVFVVSSMLCGFARTMTHLIIFRGLQGLGSGGLMVLAHATVADLIPPRERGRYQGLFGGVFALCSVVGPLLGGFITEALSWRWIFFVNLPVGALALFMLEVGLKHRNRAVAHRIDYAGACYMTVATTCLLLALSWGGSLYGWFDLPIVGLGVATVLFYYLFFRCERHATEPVLPLRLFDNLTFNIISLVTFLTGMAMMGSMVFLPLFFQLVLGASPSKAGLMMAPAMGGMIVAAVLSGQLISRTGLYKGFTLAGLILAAASLFAMAWVAYTQSSVPLVESIMVVQGFGMGMVMPNLMVALQNAVAHADMGVATSSSSFFRSLSGASGVAISGALMTFELHRLLPPAFIRAEGGSHSILDRGVEYISVLPVAQHDMVLSAFRYATAATFVFGGVMMFLSLMTMLFLPEIPLRSTHLSVTEVEDSNVS